MTNAAVTISFEPSEASVVAGRPDLRVTLEAETQPESATRVTLDDLDAMLARAASGRSARSVLPERCPCARFRDSAVIVTLAVLVWPSRPDLRYDLDLPPEATPGEVSVIREERRYTGWVSGGGVLDLPWRMESGRPIWSRGCWDAFSNAVPGPQLTHDHARIIVGGEAEVYGLVELVGMATGFRHEFSIEFGKFDAAGEPQAVDIDTVPVTARWQDAEGEEETAEIDVPIPACARALLESCPDGQGVFRGEAKAREQGHYEVAYSACTGKVLGTRYVEPPQ